MDYIQKINEISEYIKEHLSEKRYKHTLGVVLTATNLAKRYNEDLDKTKLAALAHDICKEDKYDVNEIVIKYSLPKSYITSPQLIHSKLGAVFLKEQFGVLDNDILNAISFHTTGRYNMSKLEKIIYLADAIEPNREYKEVNEIREASLRDLDEAVYLMLKKSVEFLEYKNTEVDFDTLDAIRYYEGERMENIDLVNICVNVLSDKKAENIKVIDIREKASFADYLVLASGTSKRQINNLVDYVEDELNKNGLFAKSIEGKNNSGWILCDFGEICVNLFTEEFRDKYNLEKVWGDCPIIEY